MLNKIDNYLDELRKELSGYDPALIQDALFDAEEHLRNAFEEAQTVKPEITESEAMPSIIEKYGTPRDTAKAYLEIEDYLTPAIKSRKKGRKLDNLLADFFGIIADPQAWKAFLYMIFSITGMIYGLWGIIGLMFCVFTPFAIIVFPSIRVIALLEGRIVEALLEIRMPRKPIFQKKASEGLIARIKTLITDPITWKSLAYMILQFPLGLIYAVTPLISMAVSLKFILYPLLDPVFGRPLITIKETAYFAPVWTFPLIFAVGVILLFSTMHMVKLIGKLHGRYAKAMLVKK